jgi:hypothetical protein
MQVPLLDVCPQNAPIEKELRAAADAGVRLAIGLSSRTDAILVASTTRLAH